MVCGRSRQLLPHCLYLALCITFRHTITAAEQGASELQVCSIADCSNQPNFTFTSPKGIFVQESESARLQRPGQHSQFGALIPWASIHHRITPGRKLLLLVRHGEAVSNAVQAYVGEEAWKEVATRCSWRNASSGDSLQLFDPSLTLKGQRQAADLREALTEGDTKLSVLTASKPYRTVVSPLSRTLQTYLFGLDGLLDGALVRVDEFCRERFGHNTCDARSPASFDSSAGVGLDLAGDDSNEPHKAAALEGAQRHAISCPPSSSLSEKFPKFNFPVAGLGGALGLVANEDVWWQDNSRETDVEIEQRAHSFLVRIFDNVREDVVFVVSHSGMIAAILRAMGREGYPAQNAELVPAIVEARGSASMTAS